MHLERRRVLLIQLPIPPLGPQPIRGNVPLAAGYLKLFAHNRGLESFYDIDIFPPVAANTLNDCNFVHAILEREPWLVGFTCYLWNIDRTLWIAEKLKAARPELRIILGGPEITADNAWVLQHPAVDFAAIGEGEQTFADLLLSLIHDDMPPVPIDGLCVTSVRDAAGMPVLPKFRAPLPKLDAISSPYLAGILDAADEEMLLLETIRGCVFKCKFCYYPKSYDALYFLSRDKIIANLQHARERGAKEVVLLDPTLNQRKDFTDFLRLLAECNPGRQFTYFGELRAEGITTETARLLRDANFTEVEVGLQSIDPHAQELMDRKNNLKAVERGIRAMMAERIKVKVDLIVGLPGDTVESVREGMYYLRESELYTDVQMFNLAILPGTAFRHEAEQLGLVFQPRPPYYVLQTPTLRREDMFALLQEAQEVFGIDWDPLPPPVLPHGADIRGDQSCWRVNLDQPMGQYLSDRHAQAHTLWLLSTDFTQAQHKAASAIEALLEANPFTTLQVVLEPTGVAEQLSPRILERLLAACQRRPTYLDRFYALQPGRPIGAKRLVVVLPNSIRPQVSAAWLNEIGLLASTVWQGGLDRGVELEAHEFALA